MLSKADTVDLMKRHDHGTMTTSSAVTSAPESDRVAGLSNGRGGIQCLETDRPDHRMPVSKCIQREWDEAFADVRTRPLHTCPDLGYRPVGLFWIWMGTDAPTGMLPPDALCESSA